ncbi:hypothetical protein AUC68_08675 [Methyloceanibacter methanicus]|uniref:Uncharacterized protein n=1 Tax=Methyloceanibacter methanicus TaxID=1774968 RepID=A0A1E3VY87_9HYPH|nr:hypothetical protein AUC68_08675 [Methyloceanibacter methanicus]
MITMMGCSFLVRMAAIAAALSVFPVAPALAEDAAPDADVVGKASSPSHKAPIKVEVVDYKRGEDGPGTLKMSGKAIPGLDLHVFVDDRPFALVKMAEGEGTWSTEDQIQLSEDVHVVRIQQFDEKTQMPAATAMFRLKLTPPSPEDLAAPPPSR